MIKNLLIQLYSIYLLTFNTVKDLFLIDLVTQTNLYLILLGFSFLITFHLLEKNYLKTCVYIIFSIFTLITLKQIVFLFSNIGYDTLLELSDFNFHDALFFVKNFIIQIYYIFFKWLGFITLLKYLFFLLFSTTILFLLIKLYSYKVEHKKKWMQKIIFYCGLILTLISILRLLIIPYISISKDKDNFERMYENFNTSFKVDNFEKNGLNLFIYIGESTTSMNMNIYDYFRETTPYLTKLYNEQKILKFDNVLSTHTHTSQSLLDAFSFDLGLEDNKNIPIDQRKKANLLSYLKQNEINSEIFNNHGYSGSWNRTSSIIFKGIKNNVPYKNLYLGNAQYWIDERVYDSSFLQTIDFENKFSDNQIIIFHSFAGHGEYLSNIPEMYQNKIDNFYDGLSKKSIYGKIGDGSIEHYDSTIRYIDSNLQYVINQISKINKPIAMIYFSDHGESVFTNRSHNSSQFTHEMIRVPFLIYFNDLAKKKYKNLYEKLSTNKKLSTLDKLSETIIDLVSINPLDINQLSNRKKDNAIVIRKLTSGELTKVDNPLNNDKEIDLANDSATDIFFISNELNSNKNKFCYHATNTVAKIIRGAHAAKCIELDIFIENQDIFINHPPQEKTGLKLQHLESLLKNIDDLTIWLDSKNINLENNCNTLANYLEKSTLNEKHDLFIEFPPNTYKNLSKIKNCAQRLKDQNTKLSYYLPTDYGKKCLDNNENNECKKIEQILNDIHNLKIIKNLSFDYSIKKSFEKLEVSNNFILNTWNISNNAIQDLEFDKYYLIINSTLDPNDL